MRKVLLVLLVAASTFLFSNRNSMFFVPFEVLLYRIETGAEKYSFIIITIL